MTNSSVVMGTVNHPAETKLWVSWLPLTVLVMPRTLLARVTPWPGKVKDGEVVMIVGCVWASAQAVYL